MPKPNMSRARLGCLLVTPELLLEALKAPHFTELRGASFDGVYVRLVIEHPDLPEIALAEGATPTPCVIEYEVTHARIKAV